MAKRRMSRTWNGPEDLEGLFWSGRIARARDGLTLDQHCVIADELGRAVEEFMGYAETAFEEVTPTTWARKMFQVDNPDVRDATLCVAGTRLRGRGTLAGTFNGAPFTWPARANCRPWYSDWVLIPAPAPLREGENELILHTTRSLAWRLFVEPSVLPNQSARSTDAGLTWDDEHLGLGGFLDGEYVVRLSGRRPASEGTITSPPIQVASDDSSAPAVGRVGELKVTSNVRAGVHVRLGTGPWIGRHGVWTPWEEATPGAAAALEKTLAEPGPRFAQFRLTLTPNRRTLPTLRRVRLTASLEPAADRRPPAVEVEGPPTVLGGRHFAHQRLSKRLARLRRHFGLERVWAAGDDPWESLLHLAAWTGEYCSFREKGDLLIAARYDTLPLLELGHARRSRVMCGHLAFALVQLAASFGLTGRVLCRGNHLVTEFWSPVHRKWAVVDPMEPILERRTKRTVWTPGYAGFYHQGGAPLSALELGEARGSVTRTNLVWRGPGRKGSRQGRRAMVEKDLRWYRREVSYPERNNFTDACEPVFFADVFRFSGHLKYRRPGRAVMPWYPTYTSRRGDLEWTVGETSVFLTALAGGEMLVQLRSQLPNTVAFDLGPLGRVDGDTATWNPADTDTLTVRAVNALGQSGPPTVCRTVS
jgi:hypothetical protein